MRIFVLLVTLLALPALADPPCVGLHQLRHDGLRCCEPLVSAYERCRTPEEFHLLIDYLNQSHQTGRIDPPTLAAAERYVAAHAGEDQWAAFPGPASNSPPMLALPVAQDEYADAIARQKADYERRQAAAKVGSACASAGQLCFAFDQCCGGLTCFEGNCHTRAEVSERIKRERERIAAAKAESARRAAQAASSGSASGTTYYGGSASVKVGGNQNCGWSAGTSCVRYDGVATPYSSCVGGNCTFKSVEQIHNEVYSKPSSIPPISNFNDDD